MDNTFKSQSVLSLCTGMRGLERGIERAVGSIRTVAYVEIETFVIENLVAQMEQGVLAPTPVWANLKTFPSEQFYRKIHGVTGGYPCQPFSVAGKQRGTNDPRHLWPYIGGSENSIVGSIRPFWCFFENVPGHLNLGYEEVRRNLQGLGYKVKEGIFSAEEVGAPHQRKRLFILGVREDILENSKRSPIWDKAREIGGRVREEDVRQRDWEKLPVWARTTSELADPKHNGHTTSQIRESTEARNGGCSSGESTSKQFEGCSELADSDNGRSGENSKCCELWPKSIKQSSSNSRRTTEGQNEKEQIAGWPARPGQNQYEWEPPRVESKLGYVFNGYDFRGDLLRMAGNGVVEQTAEKAWVTLWKDIL